MDACVHLDVDQHNQARSLKRIIHKLPDMKWINVCKAENNNSYYKAHLKNKRCLMKHKELEKRSEIDDYVFYLQLT